MPTAYTSLLKLALPVEGELTGTWGDLVNDSITQLLDDAIAGTSSYDVSLGTWTLTNPDGASGTARSAILRLYGTAGGAVNILAPNQSKAYVIINSSNVSVTIKGVTGPTTGVTVTAGSQTVVVWDNSDFVNISSGTVTSVAATVPSFLSVSGSPITSSGTLAISLSGTALPVANGGTGTTTPALVAGSNVTITGTWPNQTIAASGGGGGTVTSVAALTLGTTGTDVSSTVANSTTTPVITLNIPTASASNRGALSSTDWNTFNGKYSTGGALGTPSSGTLTNCTGYTYANLSGTVPTWNQNTTGTAANLTAATTLPSGTTLVAPILGTPSSGTLSSCTVDGTNAVGFKNIPQSGSDKVTTYPLVLADVGKYISVGSGGAITVPDATFSAGDAVSIFNNTSGNITLTMTITTAYISGTDADKNTITLATRGIATILFLSGTICVVSGNVS